MESLLIVGALVILVGAVLGIVSWLRINRLSAEVAKLRAGLRIVRNDQLAARGEPLLGETPPSTVEKELPPSLSEEEPKESLKEDASSTPAEVAAQETSDVSSEHPAPERNRDMEQALGGKWAVWVGGLALAFGAVFLVRYSIEQGLLDPKTRLALGFAFALLLLGLGEWTRRRGAFFSVPGYDSANIPATLTAAGILGAFASMYVAYGVYNFIGPAFAFIGMGIVAVGALMAALLHGPALAAIGLVAAYAAPFLVSTTAPVPWSLAIYALFVGATALVVSRWRMWRWLAIAAGAGLIFFAVILSTIDHPLTRLTLDLYLLVALAMIAYVFVISIYLADGNWTFKTDRPATILLSGIMLSTIPLMQYEPVALLSFIEMTTVLITGLALVFYFPQIRYLALTTIAVVTLRYLSFDVPFSQYGGLVEGFGNDGPGSVVSLLVVKNANTFIAAGLILALYAIAIGYWAATRSYSRVLLSVSATVLPIILLIITWMKVESFARSYVFFAVGLALLAVFAWIAVTLLATEKTGPETEDESSGWPTTIFISGAFATLALSVTIVLEKGFLTIALAMIVPAIAYVHSMRPMPGLKQLAIGLMAVWICRVAYDPAIVGGALGTTPIFNWLLYGWGLSSAAFITACILFKREDSDLWMDIVEGISIAVVTITIALLLTHAWEPSELFTITDTLVEAALLVMTSGGVALGLLHARRNQSRSVNTGIDILGYAGMAIALVLLVVAFNPVLSGEKISDGLIFNAITLSYLVPALLFSLLGWFAKKHRPALYTRAAFATSGILAFTWITLLIRHYYNPGRMHFGATTDAELYTYSIVWLVIGVGLLALGLVVNNQILRKVSGGLIVLVILKVFLIDMSNLTGILRAISFIGLGGVLVAVGLVYQRLLRKVEPSEANNQADRDTANE